MTRKFSSTSIEATLASGISSSTATITVSADTASTLLGGVVLGAGDQFTLAIDPDTVKEEIVFVTSTSGNPVSGDAIAVLRGQAGTGNIAHDTGAVVKHVLTSNDLDYFTTGIDTAVTATSTTTVSNKSISLSTNTVTGTTAQFNTALTDNNFATIAGTETLTNKTLTTPTITSATITTPVITFPVMSVAINAQTAAYTLTAGDKSKLVVVTSATTANVTVPPSVFSQGDVVYISRSGAGTLSLTQGAGVTISATPGLALRAQASVAAIICTGTNTFIATGDLSA